MTFLAKKLLKLADFLELDDCFLKIIRSERLAKNERNA